MTKKLIKLKQIIETTIERKPSVSTGGIPQNWLLNIRRIVLNSSTRILLVDALVELINLEISISSIAVPEGSVVAIGTSLSEAIGKRLELDIGVIVVRKERKRYGIASVFDGDADIDSKVILLDDTFNSGETIARMVTALTEIGIQPNIVLCVVDYENPIGHELLATHKLELRSIFKLSEFGLSVQVAKPKSPTRRYSMLWRQDEPGANAFYDVPKSAPVISKDCILVGSDRGALVCRSLETGTMLWQFEAKGSHEGKGIWSTPLVNDGRVYFGAYNGCLYALDLSTGIEIWSKPLCDWIGASPCYIPRHDLICIGLEYERSWSRGAIAAFHATTGELAWYHPLKGLQHGSASYCDTDDAIYCGTADHELVKFDAETGAIRWSRPLTRSVKASPALDVASGTVACMCFDGTVFLHRMTDGEELGRWSTNAPSFGRPLYFDNRLFVSSGDKNLYTISVTKREINKKRYLGSRVYSSPVLVGTSVIVGTSSGVVNEICAVTLNLLGRLQVIDAVTTPVAVTPDGSTFVVNTAMNQLFAIKRKVLA